MTVREITAEAAHEELARFHVVDVREPHEFDGPLGHITGGELVPLSTLREHVERLRAVGPLLLVCRSGMRSARACEQLQELGSESATNLAGGMIAWNCARLPLERRAPTDRGALIDSIVAWLAQVTATSRDGARERFASWLSEAGASLTDPDASAIGIALDSMEGELGAARAPADLELTLAAYRRDLARL